MFAKTDHPELSSLSIGVLIASYQFSFIISAVTIGHNLTKFGRKKALFCSISVTTLATATFATAGLIDSDIGFYAVSFLARCI